MNNKTVGTILLSAAGLVAAVGAAGAQIAAAIVLGQFYVSRTSGIVPPGPEHASLHWLVIVAVLGLVASGCKFLFWSGPGDQAP